MRSGRVQPGGVHKDTETETETETEAGRDSHASVQTRAQGVFNPSSTEAGFAVERGDTFLVDCYYSASPSPGGGLLWGFGRLDGCLKG